MELLSTGVPGLDRVLRGGLVPRSLHVIGGLPGTGKTSIAQQISYHHAREGGKVLYLSALSETADRLVGHASGFAFFDPAVVAERIYYLSVYPKLEEGGLPSVLEETRRLCLEHKVSLLCLDGLAALKAVAPTPLDFQRFVFDLNTQMRSLGVTGLLLGHWDIDFANEPEFTVSDGIIVLTLESSIEGASRYLEVFKLRGSENLPGPHAFKISAVGVEVFPRLEAALHAEGTPQPAGEWTRLSTGTGGLDEMLRGGLPSGSVTLVAGVPGVGKTTLALSFLASLQGGGKRGVYVGFGEAPARLLTKASALGFDLGLRAGEDSQQLIWIPPLELIPDEVAWRLLSLVEREGAQGLVIDGMDRLVELLTRDGRSQSFLAALTAALRAHDVTTLLTHELVDVEASGLGSAFQHLGMAADSVVLMQYAEADSRLYRQISVLKLRESDFDPAAREFTISSGGIHVVPSSSPGEAPDPGNAGGHGRRHAR